jgi:transcriptional regulator with XRE-family HTH domain
MPERDWETFRTLIRELLRDPQVVETIRKRADISRRTLERWASGKTQEPDRKLLAKIVTALPHFREQLMPAITIALPDFCFPLIDKTKSLTEEFPLSFWLRLHETNARSPKNIHFSSILDSILLQLQSVAKSANLSFIVAQCTPPSSPERPVSSLREVGKMTSQPLVSPLDYLFLGDESLAGHSVSLCKAHVVQDVEEEHVLPVRKTRGERSAAAYPIERGGDVAGCLVISSPEPYFFTPRLQYVFQIHAFLLTLAFETGQFYRLEHIRLRPMPNEEIQSHHLLTFQDRVKCFLRQDASLSRLQAETKAWQAIEEELLASDHSFDGKGDLLHADTY